MIVWRIFAEEDDTIRPRGCGEAGAGYCTVHTVNSAVFGQYKRTDQRYIPYEIGDVSDRKTNPVMVALDWLLRLPQQRCQQNEVWTYWKFPRLQLALVWMKKIYRY
jgi:exodeoxyribonuclease V gamma subunit